ncbi:hypothetical protein EDB19DRAFT_1770675 [Suillus lakei]|nr:hypothetical protein EDB19DRAFT_1809836 [Suillus lakei]KAG1721794.1 hypothetical protein EDB19DRAFT_1770675 [Suillus lakei]
MLNVTRLLLRVSVNAALLSLQVHVLSFRGAKDAHCRASLLTCFSTCYTSTSACRRQGPITSQYESGYTCVLPER